MEITHFWEKLQVFCVHGLVLPDSISHRLNRNPLLVGSYVFAVFFNPLGWWTKLTNIFLGFSQQKKMLQEGTSWNLTRKVVFFHFWTGRTWKWITETWDWPDLNLVVGQLSVVIPCKVFPCTDDIEMCFSIFIQFLQSYIKAFDFVGICSRIWNRPCGQRTIQNMDNEPFQLGVYSLWTAIQSTCFLYIYIYLYI